MIEYAIIPIAAICNRWRGGGIYRFKWEKRLDELEAKLNKDAVDKGLSPEEWQEYERLKLLSYVLARKLVSGVVLAGLYTLIRWIDTKQVGLYTLTDPAIILAGWYLANAKGTGYGFNAIHARTATKWQGVRYMALRGLLKAPMIIALAFLYHHPINALWAALCVLDGFWYYLGGLPRENRYSVVVAEILSGANLGVMIVGVI